MGSPLTNLSETETRAAFIDPVLNRLGYNLEESIKKGYVKLEHQYRDYVIFHKGNLFDSPLIVIEAKRYNKEFKILDNKIDVSNNIMKDIIDQSFRYAEDSGIPWILTSNGRQWILLKTYIPGVPKYERIFLIINSEEEITEKWEELHSYIGLDETKPLEDRFNELEIKLTNISLMFSLPEEGLKEITGILKDIYNKLYNELIEINPLKIKEYISESNISIEGLKHKNCMMMLNKLLFINIIESFKIQNNILSRWGVLNYEKYGYKSPIYRLVNDVLKDFNQKFNGSLFNENNPIILYEWNDDALSYIIKELDKIDYHLIDNDVFGDIYEHFLGEIVEEEEDENIRKILGQYYTPKYVVDYIIENSLEEYLKNYKGDIRSIKILDPACGSGSFLIKCYNILREQYEKINNEERLKNDSGMQKYLVKYDSINDPLKYNLFGVDINPDAIELCHMNLNLQKMIADKSLRYVDPRKITEFQKMFPLFNIKNGNSLISDPEADPDYFFDWSKEYCDLFQDNLTPFDIILGNPPYVNVENLEDKQRDYYYNKYNDICIKRFDLYIPFIDNSLKYLKNNGILSFILSYAFLSQEYAENMRKKILENYYILEIVNISNYKIFRDAAVRNIIIKIKNNEDLSGLNDNLISIINQKIDPNIVGYIGGDNYYISQKTFLNSHEYMYRLDLTKKNLDIIDTIESNSFSLGDIMIASWGARGVPANNYHLDKPIENFEHICKKMVKGKDNLRYEIRYNNKWFLYDVDGVYTDKLYRPAFPELFENNKIIVSEVTGKKGIVASYDSNHYYTDHSLSCLIPKYILESKDEKFLNRRKIKINESQIEESKKYDLKYILGCINSIVNNYYYKILLGYELNVYPELIEKLRIPYVNDEQQKIIIDFVDRIIKNNKYRLSLQNVFSDLLDKFSFNFEKELSYFYPKNARDFYIDLINSNNFKVEDQITEISAKIEDMYIVIEDQKSNILYKIKFTNINMLNFFYYSIDRYIYNSNKRIFKNPLDDIKIPVISNNKSMNKENMELIMEEITQWKLNNSKDNFDGCEINGINIYEYYKLTSELDKLIDNGVMNLLNLETEIKNYIDNYCY